MDPSATGDLTRLAGHGHSWPEQIESLAAANTAYRARCYRPLTGPELNEPDQMIQAMREAALLLQDLWDEESSRGPAALDIRTAMASGDTEREIPKLVTSLNDLHTMGAELLGHLRTSVVFSRHFARQCAQLDLQEKSNLQFSLSAGMAREDLEMIEHRLDGDVAGVRSQMQTLGMYSQMLLSKSINALTSRVIVLTNRVLTLTIVLVAISVVALGISAYVAFH